LLLLWDIDRTWKTEQGPPWACESGSQVLSRIWTEWKIILSNLSSSPVESTEYTNTAIRRFCCIFCGLEVSALRHLRQDLNGGPLWAREQGCRVQRSYDRRELEKAGQVLSSPSWSRGKMFTHFTPGLERRKHVALPQLSWVRKYLVELEQSEQLYLVTWVQVLTYLPIINGMFNERSCYPYFMSKEIRKIIKNGRGSYYINIPKEIMKEIRWRERQKLTIRKSGDKLIIEDWKKDSLFTNV